MPSDVESVPKTDSNVSKDASMSRKKFGGAINMTTYTSIPTRKEMKAKIGREKKFKDAHRLKTISYLEELKK